MSPLVNVANPRIPLACPINTLFNVPLFVFKILIVQLNDALA
jgi:hypothetical protein